MTGKEKHEVPQPVVPAGYALVPVEPTDAMIEAATREYPDAGFHRSKYRAMLAAAPTTQRGTGGQEAMTSQSELIVYTFQMLDCYGDNFTYSVKASTEKEARSIVERVCDDASTGKVIKKTKIAAVNVEANLATELMEKRKKDEVLIRQMLIDLERINSAMPFSVGNQSIIAARKRLENT